MTKQRADFRTSISLSQVVWGMAERMMKDKGFNGNFSAYVADLIRRDQETRGPVVLNESPPSYKPRK